MATFTFRATTEGTSTFTEFDADVEQYRASAVAHALVAIVGNTADSIAQATDLDRADVLDPIIESLIQLKES
jgi:hypothetical protein